MIRIETRKADDYVTITVNDNGMGIRKEDYNRIFEPFFTTKRSEGTGLGLSISYSIVKKYGGEIRVKSAPGKGTRFTISLPGHDPSDKESR